MRSKFEKLNLESLIKIVTICILTTIIFIFLVKNGKFADFFCVKLDNIQIEYSTEKGGEIPFFV